MDTVYLFERLHTHTPKNINPSNKLAIFQLPFKGKNACLRFVGGIINCGLHAGGRCAHGCAQELGENEVSEVEIIVFIMLDIADFIAKSG